MKRIPLSGQHGIGKFTLVDNEDYKIASLFSWSVIYSGHNPYCRTAVQIDGVVYHLYLHRLINNTPNGMLTDHINSRTLDNQKHNLRTCTRSQNLMNQMPQKRKISSFFKGVSWHIRSKKWIAKIKLNGITRHIGYYNCEETAAYAYNKEAKKLYGEFANLNKGV